MFATCEMVILSLLTLTRVYDLTYHDDWRIGKDGQRGRYENCYTSDRVVARDTDMLD